jgi:ubiquitin conjugation factor E4 B
MQDSFVKNNLINTLMVIFNDAERLGTSNQFYEKFNVRTKILMLVLENILKKDKSYSSKITEFANNNSETCTRMINLLISDLTFLNDEVLEKLEEIKKYQDLLADVYYY